MYFSPNPITRYVLLVHPNDFKPLDNDLASFIFRSSSILPQSNVFIAISVRYPSVLLNEQFERPEFESAQGRHRGIFENAPFNEAVEENEVSLTLENIN